MLTSPRPRELSPLVWRVPKNRWIAPIQKVQSLIAPTRFDLLNETGDISEIGWGGPQRSRLWRYNQHYFDDLNSVDSASRRQWHERLLIRWIAENPPVAGPGWEPYPTSLRIVNWSKFLLSGGGGTDSQLASLAGSYRGSLALCTLR